MARKKPPRRAFCAKDASKGERPQRAALSMPVTIAAAAGGAGGQDPAVAPGPRTFTAQPAYSGDPLPGYTAKPPLKMPYVIDLAGLKPAKSPKVNLDHEDGQRLGHVTEVTNDGKQLVVAGLLSASTPHRDQVIASADDGYGWEGSIEAEMWQPQTLAAGKSAQLNGRTVTGPVLIFRKSKFTQLAFVSQGADELNAIAIAASALSSKDTPMTEFDKFVCACGADPAALTDEQRVTLNELFEARQQAAAGRGKGDRVSFQSLVDEERRENARQEEIKRLAHASMKQNPQAIDHIEQLAQAAIDSGADRDKFELELLRSTRVQAGKFSSPRPHARVVEAALCMAGGLPNVETVYGPEIMQLVDDHKMRDISLQEMIMQQAHANGYPCRPGQGITNGNIRAVLEYAFPPVTARLAGGFSTASLPGILGNVANKFVEVGYKEEDTSWREVAKIKPVSNFYQQTHYRMLDNMEFEEVGPTGELHHGSFGEESFTSQAKTYGKLAGLSRHQIINDDLGAFDDIRERLGRGGSKKFSSVFWTNFMAYLATMFTAGRGNYISGSTTNLGLDGVGLELGITAAQTMTSPSADGSKRVGAGVRPTILLVPPELQFIADRLHQSSNVNTGGSATATSVPNANIHVNKYRPVVQWRLSNSGYTGYSTTHWFLFGNDLKPMLVTFLNGMQTPVIESADADFEVLGVMFRSYWDWGADPSEYLAGAMSKGAA